MTRTEEIKKLFGVEGNPFLWLTALAVALGVFAFETQSIIVDYVENPTTVVISVNYSTQLKVPDIAICSALRLNASSMKESGIPDLVSEAVFTDFTMNSYDSIGDLDPSDRVHWKEIEPYMNGSYYNFLLTHRLDCHQLFLRCQFQWNQFDCCQMAVPIVHETFGVCYVLRAPASDSRMRYIDEDAGYSLLINPMPKTAMKDLPARYSPMEVGAMMELYDVYNETMRDPVTFAPNKEVTIGVKIQKFERITKQGKDCTPVLKPHWTYRGGLAKCLNAAIVVTCNCTMVSYNKALETPYCLPGQAETCLIRKEKEFEQIHHDCLLKSGGKPMCYEWSYDLTVSTMDLDLSTLKRLRPAKYREVDHVVKLRIHFPGLATTLVKELERYTPDILISNIAGQWGMLIGGSLVSLYGMIVAGARIFYRGSIHPF